jgi:hypothetical protein
MWFKVKDATIAVANVDDYSGSAKLLAGHYPEKYSWHKKLG